MSVSNGLFILHDLHLKFKSVQDELDRGPRLIKAKENLLAKRQAELDSRQPTDRDPIIADHRVNSGEPPR